MATSSLLLLFLIVNIPVDYVTIISGDTVLLLDPHEATTCRELDLRLLTTVLPSDTCQWLWGDYLTPQVLSAGYLHATIFWFPLRQQASKISTTVYSPERVSSLFNSFMVEAPNCLTFLKSLEKFSLKMKNGNGEQILLEVALLSSDLQELRRKRLAFRKELEEYSQNPKDITCAYDVTISAAIQGRTTSVQTLSVLHFVPRDASRTNLRHIPQVGVAAATAPAGQASGQLFCFLPLPPDPANNTGLPVLVQGFFFLSQNRRHVKWRTGEGGEDPDVLWNEELVRGAVTEAYFTFLTNHLEKVKLGLATVDAWYSLLPDFGATADRWRMLATRIWERMKTQPILYSENLRCFMSPQQVVINSCGEVDVDVYQAVEKALANMNAPLVKVRQGILDSLSAVGVVPLFVSPPLARQFLRQKDLGSENWSLDFHMKLLCYILLDGNYGDLSGIQLLPLNSGQWVSFCVAAQTVYICTEEEAGALVGLDEEILSLQLPAKCWKSLKEVERFSQTQLKLFGNDAFIDKLLRRSVVFVQTGQLHQTQVEPWLRCVWSLLQKINLQRVEDLNLVPKHLHPSSHSLIPLTSFIVLETNKKLSQATRKALALLNVIIISDLPNYVTHFQLQQYLKGTSSSEITEVLNRVACQTDLQTLQCAFNLQSTTEHVNGLVSVLDISNIKPRLRELLSRLNLFRARDDRKVLYTSINVCGKISPHHSWLPVQVPELLIMPDNEVISRLAMVLGAAQLSSEDLVLLALQYHYTQCNLKRLINYVLCDPQLVNSWRVQTKLQCCPFICTRGLRYLQPGQAFDPEDTDRDALLGEDLFPEQDFEKHLPILRRLGMKTVEQMPAEQLVSIVKGIQYSPLTKEDRKKKVDALLGVINRRQDCQHLCTKLRDTPWVFGSPRPLAHEFPRNLHWATTEELLKPGEARSFTYMEICGSVVPLVSCSHLPRVAEGFGWTQAPDDEKVKTHLQNMIRTFHKSASGYQDLIKKTYRHLALNCSSNTRNFLRSKPLVFTEHGFVLPEQVFVSRNSEDISMAPYIYPLPFCLQELSNFFVGLGCFETQSNDLCLSLLEAIQKRHKLGGVLFPEHDRSLAITALRKIEIDRGNVDLSQLLLPIVTEDGSLQFAEVSKCSYSDQPWLDGEDLGVDLVHSCVGTPLAKSLGVKSLTNHLTNRGEVFTEYGQQEPLTTRLRNILRQYPDGMALFKEMIQNADDAGATTVSFLYDERLNEDATSRLINPLLKECQGPALWVHNDAKFTKQDLDNLRKLGEGTKKCQATKIGKFGLGFASVYNLTDVPSLVSGSSYVVFDPHCSYVNGTLGMRYDFAGENSVMLRKLCDQFQPFQDVFDCDIQGTSNFDGTLFRLPLRTPDQARRSKICGRSCQKSDMKELLQMFSNIIGEILLFTQHVQEVRVFHLKNDSSPKEKVLLMRSVRKEKEKLKVLEDKLGKISIAENPVTSIADLFDEKHIWNQETFQQSTLFDIQVEHTHEGTQICEVDCSNFTVTWLTSWHTGYGDSCRLAQEMGGRDLPLGAVSVPVKTKKPWMPIKLWELPRGFYRHGHLHCSLPLPIQTTLMVQVNGFFSITSDRRGLEVNTEDDRQSLDWNSTLMKDAVMAAYHSLLATLRLKGLSRDCKYYCLWPVTEEVRSATSLLTQSFYEAIAERDFTVFRDQLSWVPFSKCFFMKDEFLTFEKVRGSALQLMRILLQSSDEQIMELPNSICHGFPESISSRIITPEKFFSDFFLVNMREQHLKQDKITELILHLLDYYPDIAQEHKELVCIPTKPSSKLRKVDELINPHSTIAKMYRVSDERFPLDGFLENRIQILRKLGMMEKEITPEMLFDRVESVQHLKCSQCGKERASIILTYLTDKLWYPLPNQKNELQRMCAEIQDISFLPILPKPSDWNISWKGDFHTTKKSKDCKVHSKGRPSISFSSPRSMCLPQFKALVGSTKFIFNNEGYSHERTHTLSLLGMVTSEERVSTETIITQLHFLREECGSNYSSVQDKCHQIYEFLEKRAKNTDLLLTELVDQKILITKFGFIEPSRFSFLAENSCAPDLFSVKTENLGKYERLMKALGVEDHFHPQKVFEVLIDKQEHTKMSVSDEVIDQISKLLNLLFKEIADNPSEDIDLSRLHLPDAESNLVPIGKLCIDDGAEVSSGDFKYLHGKILLSQDNIKQLGLQSKSSKRLNESCYLLKYGQKEELTTRLKNILKDYPCDSGIMKELLQNADDAGATEISFIVDYRQHSKERIFDERLAPLQGPALCVYNDKCFEEKDIEGISMLGVGSKGKDPASTGQYGIGFNAVYHLTDAPSFLTRSSRPLYRNNHKETLCIFDPHCRYVPGAEAKSHGGQFINLEQLRVDYPDTFSGYLDGLILKEEGTVFRFPLRDTEDSLISQTAMTTSDLKEKMQEFKKEINRCLLFLRSVRKISIKHVGTSGNCVEDYVVQAFVRDDGESKLQQLQNEIALKKKTLERKCFDSYFHNMLKISYMMVIKETEGKEHYTSSWHIAQQLGAEDSQDLPSEGVQHAFTNELLGLLPHAGIAIPLQQDSKMKDMQMTTFCYLPLPAKSGLPFCVNGHFALNTSRRDICPGHDFMGEWNDWLMKAIIAPVAVQAVDYCRQRTFSDHKGQISFETYEKYRDTYYNTLPDSHVKDNWKKFPYWFYDYACKYRVAIFDSFVPLEDIPSNKVFAPAELKLSAIKKLQGTLLWHSLRNEDDEFPLYFPETPVALGKELQSVFKRLGMKIGSGKIARKLKAVEFKYDTINPDSAIDFLLSWTSNSPDKCSLEVATPISESPYLSTENAVGIAKFLIKSKKFVSKIENLPLLVTGDGYLHAFTEENPRFTSSYYTLLPCSKEEFLNEDMRESFKSLNVSQEGLKVLKPFTLSDLAERISKLFSLGQRHLVKDKEMSKWLKTFWMFVKIDIKKKFTYKEKRQQGVFETKIDWRAGKDSLISLLGDWQLYPVITNGKASRIPICKSYTVLDEKAYRGNAIFGNLPIPCSNTTDFAVPDELQLTATLDQPETVLDALYYHRDTIERKVPLGHIKCVQILEYFGERIQEGARLSREKLTSLPLYRHISRTYISIDNKKLIVPETSSSILSKILEYFNRRRDVCVLQITTSESLKSLYSYLEPLYLLSDLEIYDQFILPNIRQLGSVQISEHMKVLKRLLSRTRDIEEEMWDDLERKVISQLRATRFITLEGSLRTASCVYSNCNPVFQAMGLCNLPNEWCAVEWRWFLKLAGMKCDITTDMFLEYIRSLSITDTEVNEKSESLVEYLVSHLDEFEDVLNEIKDIEFLVPYTDDALGEIAGQFKTDSELMSFSDAYFQEYKYLLWTTANLMPSSIEAMVNGSSAVEQLEIPCKPSDDLIFDHIQNICSSLERVPKSVNDKLSDVMKDIYDFLDGREEKFLRSMDGIPIIHIPEKLICVKPISVARDLEHEIIPYIHKAPIQYSHYFHVFANLGVTKATCSVYAKVLLQINERYHNEILNEEGGECVKEALRGMVKNEKGLADLDISELYLPTKDGKLTQSTCIYVANNAKFEKALSSDLDKPLFTGFQELGIDNITDSDFVRHLPFHLRPTFLSDVVEQEYIDDSMNTLQDPFLESIKIGLASQQFKAAALRIFNHHSQMPLKDCELKNILEKLESVSLKAVTNITVKFTFQGKEVGSETHDTGCFLKTVLTNEIQHIILYFCTPIREAKVIPELRKAFRKVFDLEQQMEDDIEEMLILIREPSEMHKTLDDRQVKDFRSREFDKAAPFFDVTIGSYLDLTAIHLLHVEMCRFQEGEMVCMKKYIEEDAEDIFLAVRVVRRVTYLDDPLRDEYEVNTGSELEPLVTVKAHQLYRLAGRENSRSKDLVPYESVPDMTEDTRMRDIRTQVLDIWSVGNESERRHLLRRFMLQWHPDKNPEDPESATQVMQYVQSLLARLESGETIPEDDSHETFAESRPCSSFAEVFQSPPNYYTQSWEEDEQASQKMPDKREAKKWVEQAEHDLEEAQKRKGGSACWIAYMCHQASEKSLKAALYLEDRVRAQQYQSGPNCHDLMAIANNVSGQEHLALAGDIETRTGHHTRMRYPTTPGIPCQLYTEEDAEYVLEKAALLFELLRARF